MDLEGLLASLNIKATGQDPRYQRLNLLEMFLKGTQYSNLPFPYQVHPDLEDEIPIRSRKPSVIYNLAKILVDRSTDMLFGDEHFPLVTVEDKEQKDTQQALDILLKFSSFKETWRHVARMGSVGSVFIVFKIIDSELFHEVINSKDCHVIWHPRKPQEVIEVSQRMQLKGYDLAPMGYPNLEDEKTYYYRRDFTENSEIEYFPVEVQETVKLGGVPKWRRNDDRSFDHNLGFLPGVWIKNLPSDDIIDGASTFEGVLDYITEISYNLSSTGRVFDRTGNPTTVINDPSVLDPEDPTIINRFRKRGSVLLLNEGASAENLEMQGDSQHIALEYVEKLRKFALEIGRGNRADPDKISASQSGKALALLHKDLIGLVGELRLSYGDGGLCTYLKKILKALDKYQLNYPGLKQLKIDPNIYINLVWGAFFEPTSQDDMQTAQFVTECINNGTMQRLTGTKLISERANINDPEEEQTAVVKQKEDDLKLAAKYDQSQQVSQQQKTKALDSGHTASPAKVKE